MGAEMRESAGRDGIESLPAPTGASLDLRKAFTDFLIATVPAVVLYFTGWAYFFLSTFGVNIAEIHMDTPTVFIYSAPPLYALLINYGLYVLAVAIGGTLIV
jgi:hypothetical protein